MKCLLRDPLPNQASRRPCEPCQELAPKQVTPSRDVPGVPTLRQLLSPSSGMAMEVYRATRMLTKARRVREMWRNTPEGDHAASWCSVYAAEVAHWEATYARWKRRLDAHPELADRPITDECSHGRGCPAEMEG